MRNVKNRRTRMLLFIAFLAAAAILGTLMLQKYSGKEDLPQAPVKPHKHGPVRVTLFFASPEGDGLVREGSEIEPETRDLAGLVRSTVEKLVDGPLGNPAPTLPAATVVRDVHIQGDTAQIDLSRDFSTGLPGGSSSEISAVYSIINTVSFNFPDIRKVKLLLEGEQVETLKGHLDLRQPIQPNYQLEKDKAAPAGPPQQ